MSNPISVQAINELRQKTGAGLLMTKQALEEANGDMEKATIILRTKGVNDAGRRSNRVTFEGVIESYIHVGSKTGVLIEVQCETDFVARSDEFKQFVRDLCLQIAATAPTYIDRSEIPDAETQKEFAIYRTGLENKPQAAQDKIIAGKFEKWYSTVCLLDQPFVKDPTKTIKQLLEDIKLRTRENIKVARFTRYEVGHIPQQIRDRMVAGEH